MIKPLRTIVPGASTLAFLLAIEGADGAGKATTARSLRDLLTARGRRVAVVDFPRYGATVGGTTIGRFLAGELPVPVTPQAAAVLYALDRLESREAIADAAAAHDVVLFDRYIASNMAYQAAKLTPDAAPAMMAWIEALETGQFALPQPDLCVYLETPWDVARDLIQRKRPRSYTDRSFDAHEADAALQLRVRANYAAMAADAMLAPWRTVRTTDGGALRPPEEIAAEIAAHVEEMSHGRAAPHPPRLDTGGPHAAW